MGFRKKELGVKGVKRNDNVYKVIMIMNIDFLSSRKGFTVAAGLERKNPTDLFATAGQKSALRHLQHLFLATPPPSSYNLYLNFYPVFFTNLMSDRASSAEVRWAAAAAAVVRWQRVR